MNFIFDVFLLLIVILVTVIGTKRGFVRSVWSSVTIIGSFAIAYAFGPSVGELVCLDFILPSMTEYTFGIISSLVSATAGSYDISELFTSLPSEFIILAESCGANIDGLQDEFASAIMISEERLYSLANSIALPVSRTLSHALGVIITFFASIIILTIIGFIIKIISKIPVIKTLDGILGALLGLVKGTVIVIMICIAAAIFVECEFMNGNVGVYFKILTDNSFIFRFFCSFSPIDFINIG